MGNSSSNIPECEEYEAELSLRSPLLYFFPLIAASDRSDLFYLSSESYHFY